MAPCPAQVILSFVDNWQFTGGVDQFVKWSGTGTVHAEFFSDSNCMQLYKNTVSAVVNRVNTINGRTWVLLLLHSAMWCGLGGSYCGIASAGCAVSTLSCAYMSAYGHNAHHAQQTLHFPTVQVQERPHHIWMEPHQ